MVRKFHVDWKAECGQLNASHITKNDKCRKKKLNTIFHKNETSFLPFFKSQKPRQKPRFSKYHLTFKVAVFF